ncbi:hypothetical protein AM587_10001438 [Phytophthora nicotianae]|uniref:Uncharacterized protein n=1 Tax=Phytophthora nicotianae TaxID=4792 RepID=A0A0W8CFJ4_PHYNI|nr:hypothetical protein AM587_10001644 [Phytophthora nicotianae]KUF91631.1 hypothetical protein AM587_10001438 [Phytophthora nicotianae]
MPSPKKHDSSTKAEASQQGPRKLSNTNKRASTHADGRAVAQNFVVADSSINEETKISTRYKATAKADVSFRESAYNLSKRPVEGQHGAANGVLISSSTMCAEIRPSPPTSNSTTENETTDPSTTSKPAKLPPAPTPPAHYVSPVKRYRLLRAEQAADREIVTAVEQMQDFIRVNDVNQPTVRARLQGRGRVVWTSTHIVKTGELSCIHIVDLHAQNRCKSCSKHFEITMIVTTRRWNNFW